VTVKAIGESFCGLFAAPSSLDGCVAESRQK
jgi:hypothetical protein